MFIISAVDSKYAIPMERTEFPKAYLKNCLPTEKEETVTPDKIKRWEHLKPISKVITHMENIEAEMPSGGNCIKALEPMGIISSRNGGLYAYRKKLGWCIVGPITTSRNDGSVKCHRMAVKDVISRKMEPHHFALDDEPEIEDAGTKEMLEPMHYSDFCECNHLQVNIILVFFAK